TSQVRARARMADASFVIGGSIMPRSREFKGGSRHSRQPHRRPRSTMIHELRIYHCVPGRLPALHRRFENVTLDLWKRHGIRQVGFWTVAIGPSSAALYYLLEWENLAEREQRW